VTVLRSRWLVWLVVLLLAAASVALVHPYAVTAAFLLDLAGDASWRRAVLPVRVHEVQTRDLEVPTRHGPVPARLYEPDIATRRGLAVFPGVHAGGVDEPRLDELARRLAATGTRVLSVPLPDLRAFLVTPRSTDLIEDATAWMSGDPALAPDGRVTLIGVSFAGGLAVVAAGRPSLAGRLDAVVSVGGHADLPRVLRYFCTGDLPGASAPPPHDYGPAVLTLAAVHRLVPSDQAPKLAAAIRTFLEASSAIPGDPARARRFFEDAARQAETFPEPSRSIARALSRRDVAALGRLLLPHVDALGGDPALSPARSPAPTAPTFLVHGRDDIVIPSFESVWLAAHLREARTPQVRLLVTPLVTHVDTAAAPGAGDLWRLVRFWTEAMRSGPRRVLTDQRAR
jgi:pimeloyl-ACP methyl ester carboxylesterase